MGRDGTRGVVDHACRVYDASPGADPKAVHQGLYVCDGAAIPRPVGVNPLLTITALAERAMMQVATDLEKTLSDAPKPDAARRTLPAPPSAPTGLAALAQVASLSRPDAGRNRLALHAQSLRGWWRERGLCISRDGGTSAAGVEFTERMVGYISDRGADHAAAAAAGQAAGNEFSFTVTVRIADVDRFVSDPAHAGTLTGTAHCPALSPEPLDISNGVFRLMRKSDEQIETRLFEYLMTLSARDGSSYRLQRHQVRT